MRGSAYGSLTSSSMTAFRNISLRASDSKPLRKVSPHSAIISLILQIAILCRSVSHSALFSKLGNPSKLLTHFLSRSSGLITCPGLLLSRCARSKLSAENICCSSDKHLEMKFEHSKASELKKRTISCRACYGDSNQPPLAPTDPPLRQPGGLSCNGGGMS